VFAELSSDAKFPSLRKLGVSRYSAGIVDELGVSFLHISPTNPSSYRSPAFRGMMSYLLEGLSQREVGPTWKVVCDLLAEYKKDHSPSAHVGLSEHELTGLYGELWVMRNVLKPLLGSWLEVFGMWQGYEAEEKDFSNQHCALEVKANRALKADYVWVNGLNQLASVPRKRLLLCHLHFDSSHVGGESIVEIVDLIEREMCDTNLVWRFQRALIAGGYDEKHSLRWEGLRFNGPERTFCEVEKQGVPTRFPRVTSADSLSYIEDLKYKIRRDSLEPFRINQERFAFCVRGCHS
jgi:hypothetical protein